MAANNLVVLVTLLALLLYLFMLLRVGGARGRTGVAAPAVTGHPEFERHYRVQMNTLESLPIFLVSLWVFPLFWSGPVGGYVAAGLGLLWIVGRVIYMMSYVKDPQSRSIGFMVQGIGTVGLLLGSLIGVVMALIKSGAA